MNAPPGPVALHTALSWLPSKYALGSVVEKPPVVLLLVDVFRFLALTGGGSLRLRLALVLVLLEPFAPGDRPEPSDRSVEPTVSVGGGSGGVIATLASAITLRDHLSSSAASARSSSQVSSSLPNARSSMGMPRPSTEVSSGVSRMPPNTSSCPVSSLLPIPDLA